METPVAYQRPMQSPRYDIYQPDHYYPDQHYRWIDGGGDPVRAARRKSLLRIVVIVAGAVAIMTVTFLAVAAHELITSQDAKLVAQAAKDRTRATTLTMATKAKCDRLISEAKAAGEPAPACAEQPQAGPSESSEDQDPVDVGAILEGIVKAAAS